MPATLLVALLAIIALGCDGAITPSVSASASGPVASAEAGATQTAAASPTAALIPAWHADAVPHTEYWATIIVVVDLVDGVDEATARAMREAVIDLMVSATDGTEIGVVRASKGAETLVEPVAMGTGRREAIERIWSAPTDGVRDIAAALAGATALKERSHAGSINRGVLVIASRADDSVRRLLRDGSLSDVHVVAYGTSADEATLARLAQTSGGLYGHAVEPLELKRRVADVRRELEQMSLVLTGALEADEAGRASVRVGIGDGQVFARFTTYGVSSHAVTVTNADSQRFTVEQRSDDVGLSEFGERVSVGVGAASAGEWQLTLQDVPPGRSIPYEVETFFSPFPNARGRADLDATEGMAIGYMDGGLPLPTTVTATILAPDGSEQMVELGDAPKEDILVCCIGNMYELHLPGPIDGGSYVITVRSAGGEGPTSYERAVRFGFYMWPAVDSDGDGIRDQVENRNGMDPDDPADGTVDADSDGLSMSRELGDLATDPFDYDSDDGGEGDGTEVDAGRDPRNANDDKMAASCVTDETLVDSDRFRPQPNAARAPDLEAMLPDEVLGERMDKASITGTPLLHPFWPGWLWYALVECTGGFGPALEVAYASASNWGGLAVVAIRIERAEDGKLIPVPAQDVADAFLHRISPGSEDEMGPRPFELAGRTAMVTDSGLLIYPHDDVLFMMMTLAYGDCWEDCGTPPNREDLAADLLPKLPAPGD